MAHTHLSNKELHMLAMNHVGKELEAKGYEFLGVNSELGKEPQFVVLKEKQLSFIIVRAIAYPSNPQKYHIDSLKSIKEHALNFDAKLYYAGVGLAHAEEYDKPLCLGDPYVINYQGLILI